MDKIYTVNDECTEISEWPVVYESKNSYFVYDEANDGVMGFYKNKAVIDSGSFADVYNKIGGWDCISSNRYKFYMKPYFVDKELAEEFVNAVKKFGKLWSLNREIERLNNTVAEFENQRKEALAKREALTNG